MIGDKNALLIAARILGYGKDYEFEYEGKKEVVDLSKLEPKPLAPEFEAAKENLFSFTCPTTGAVLEFKLLTHADEQAVEQEIKGLRKLSKEASPELSTRLKYMILSVNGETDRQAVRSFVDNMFLARDSRAFRKFVEKIQPDIDIRFYPEDGPEEGVMIPIGASFLWPDLSV